jgi:hypothetical protein
MLILGHLLSTDVILEIVENLCVNFFQNLAPHKRWYGYGELGYLLYSVYKMLVYNFQKIH